MVTSKPLIDETLSEHYRRALRDPHTNLNDPFFINFIDFTIRELIGKTDDIRVAKCSHHAIISREFPENFCRICHKDLRRVGGRWNDYLVLRHPDCTKPICFECAEKNPDEFHNAFKLGLERYEVFRKGFRQPS